MQTTHPVKNAWNTKTILSEVPEPLSSLSIAMVQTDRSLIHFYVYNDVVYYYSSSRKDMPAIPIQLPERH
jgi:hypothetical protein